MIILTELHQMNQVSLPLHSSRAREGTAVILCWRWSHINAHCSSSEDIKDPCKAAWNILLSYADNWRPERLELPFFNQEIIQSSDQNK